MFLNKFKTGFPMCASESDTQSPAELRVQYPTMPQLLPQPAAAAKNSVLCARRALCFLARFAWARRRCRRQLSSRWRFETVVGAHRAGCLLFFFSFSAKVSFVPRVALWTTNERKNSSNRSSSVYLFFKIFFFLSNRCGSALVTHILTKLLINKRNKSEFA